MCTGEPIEQLEAELKEAQLQILHLEHLLGTAGLADDGHGHGHNGHGQGAEEGGGRKERRRTGGLDTLATPTPEGGEKGKKQ